MKPPNMLLAIIQLIHYFIDSFNMTYIVLFNPMYDIYYMIWLLLEISHWLLLKNECIISYIEKKLINNSYELGSNPRWTPYYSEYYNKWLIMLKSVILISTIIYILIRNKSKKIKMICIIVGVLWLYSTFGYDVIKKKGRNM